jgi:hypothetical protein
MDDKKFLKHFEQDLEDAISVLEEEHLLEENLDELDDWIKKSKRPVAKSFDFPSLHLNAYIRLSDKLNYDLKKKIPTLELASIDVDLDARNKGYAKKFIDLFEKVAFDNNRNVFIELVHSPILEKILQKRNYIEDSFSSMYDPDSPKSYWKLL